MRELVFSQVLWQSEDLAAELAWKRLLATVYVIVSLQGKLGCEALVTLGELALVDSSWIVPFLFGMRRLLDLLTHEGLKMLIVVFKKHVREGYLISNLFIIDKVRKH